MPKILIHYVHNLKPIVLKTLTNDAQILTHCALNLTLYVTISNIQRNLIHLCSNRFSNH